MNDFTTSFENNTENHGENTSHFFTSRDLRPETNRWAIGAGVAALVALIGIGATTVLGSDSTAETETVAPVTAPAAAPVVTEAPASSTPAAHEAPAVQAAPTATVAEAAPTPEPAAAPAGPAASAAPAAQPAPARADDGPCPTYTVDTTFPIGLCAKGDLVAEVQQAIGQTIYQFDVDGFYGPDTDSVVRMLQGSFGFPVTGEVDEAFYNTLLSSWSDRGEDEMGDDTWTDTAIATPADDDGMNAGHDPEYYDPGFDGYGDNQGDEGEGPHGDHLDGSYDDYCIALLADPTHVDATQENIDNCIDWLTI